MSDPNDLDADATLPPDPLGSTIPAPPPAFTVDGVPAFEVPVDRAPIFVDGARPAWFFSDNWDGFASPALDEE